jgi:RNA polymerase sigma factor (sigma-70 family)
MTVLTPEPAAPLTDEEHFRLIYEEYTDMLVGIAVQKFGIADSEAETLVHEVFISYLRKASLIADLRGWLIGAICHASRHYWRLNRRVLTAADVAEHDRPDPSSSRILDSLPDQLAAREALECLSPRCQEILRLRFFEGCTMPEIGARIGCKPKYAQKLVTNCLRRAEKLYGEKGRLQ